jgi:acyl-CoA thioesterase-1
MTMRRRAATPGRLCGAGGLALLLMLICATVKAQQIVAFGASTVSGFNVAARDAFPAQLQAMLHAKGYAGVRVVNAGIYGNTTADMRARMDRDIPPGTRIVLLDTSGGIFNDLHQGVSRQQGETDLAAISGIFNDLHQGVSRQQGETDLAAISASLNARGVTVIRFSGSDLPAQYHQTDGVHLTPEGHRILARQLLPQIEQVLGAPPAAAQARPAPAAPSASPSADVRDACRADARRLCASVLGDSEQRRACMHEHRAELSHDCLAAIARSRE